MIYALVHVTHSILTFLTKYETYKTMFYSKHCLAENTPKEKTENAVESRHEI